MRTLTYLPAFALALSICGFPAIGSTIRIPSGGDLQAAINDAKAGDIIELQAGATFKGNYTLPVKSGTAFVTIRTSAWASLPAGRIALAQKSLLASIVASNGGLPALRTTRSAHHYRFIGLEFRPPDGTYTYGVISIGDGSETQISELPDYIEFDRVYVHGDAKAGGKRGIALNGRHLVVKNSYLVDFKSTWQDAQAMCGWNGAGPITIVNNYLEATGENLMFGGAKATIAGLVPANIEVRRNHFFKPLTWNPTSATYGGKSYVVKNHFELKNARNVLISGNVFENIWAHSQTGYSVVLNGGADGAASAIENATFSNNLFLNCARGLMLAANSVVRTADITVRNNLMAGVTGWLFCLIGGVKDVVIEHNTAPACDRILYVGETSAIGKNPGFVMRHNIFSRGRYGLSGIGTAEGTASLTKFFPGWVFDRNVVIGAKPTLYPAVTFCPMTLAEVGFAKPAAGDYRLTSTSPYTQAGIDGLDLGVDMRALEAAMRE